MSLTFGCVLLTMGDRPDELLKAVSSLRDQGGPVTDVLVVINSSEPITPPTGARVLLVGRNLGIPAGRNLGLQEVAGELVLFLDDDAWIESPRFVEAVLERFESDPLLGVVSCRIVDEYGETQRRHVPRLRVGDPLRSSRVTTFLGGASVIRRRAFDEVGGLPDDFIYGHEETSLAWRMIDTGWHLCYRSDLVIRHPKTEPGRHATAFRLSARNRVLLARRHLPVSFAVLYVIDWLVLSLARQPAGWRAHLAGTVAGLRHQGGSRYPIRWRTVWRLLRLGRPPVI